MDLESADIIEFGGEKFMIMDCGNYKDKKYAFLTKLDINEEPTYDNKIIEISVNKAEEISDELATILLPKFVNRLLDKE